MFHGFSEIITWPITVLREKRRMEYMYPVFVNVSYTSSMHAKEITRFSYASHTALCFNPLNELCTYLVCEIISLRSRL